MVKDIILGILFIIQCFLLFFFAYWFVISLFGFGPAKKKKQFEPKNKFLLLVAAHNESAVIGQLLDNLQNLEYPKELYDIVVIADNCTDNTAQITRDLGEIALEHFYKDGEDRGKPYAIKYALNEIDYANEYDAVAIFDADNLVTTNYLKEMNNQLESGDKLIQCYLDSKNPDDNWISLSYAATYYFMNRSWQLAKENLGLGNALGGTGFCVRTDVLKEVGWTARSLTEDLEFQMQCLLANVPAKWCHHARVFDEKPTDFKASCVQRLRWARGHWDVCFKYQHKLIWKAIKDLDIHAFDGFMYLINPGKIVLNSLMLVLSFVGLFCKQIYVHKFKFLPWWLWICIMLFQLMYLIYCMVADVKNPWKKIKSIVFLPIFNYTYIPLFIWALITKQNKSWNPTKHTRNVSIDDMGHKKDKKDK